MGLIYQLSQSSAAVDMDSTGVILRIPCIESVKIVEYGFVSVATDPGATGVLALQYIDTAGNTHGLHSFTSPTAATVNDKVIQRVDILLDVALNKSLVSVSGTPGTLTDEADGFGCFQLNVTTGFGAGVTACAYVKWALAGTPKTQTGATLLTSI